MWAHMHMHTKAKSQNMQTGLKGTSWIKSTLRGTCALSQFLHVGFKESKVDLWEQESEHG